MLSTHLSGWLSFLGMFHGAMVAKEKLREMTLCSGAKSL